MISGNRADPPLAKLDVGFVHFSVDTILDLGKENTWLCWDSTADKGRQLGRLLNCLRNFCELRVINHPVSLSFNPSNPDFDRSEMAVALFRRTILTCPTTRVGRDVYAAPAGKY